MARRRNFWTTTSLDVFSGDEDETHEEHAALNGLDDPSCFVICACSGTEWWHDHQDTDRTSSVHGFLTGTSRGTSANYYS
jgi:hypothetical protein